MLYSCNPFVISIEISLEAGCNFITPVGLTTLKSILFNITSNSTESVLDALNALDIEYFFLNPFTTVSVAISFTSFSIDVTSRIDTPSSLISSSKAPTSSGISTKVTEESLSSSSPVSASPVSIP